jgi:S1-C subfamily serine protease
MRTIRNGFGAGIFLLLLGILTGGCAHKQVAQNRDDSFLPYAQTKVGHAPLESFLNARSSMLFRADYFKVTPTGTTYGNIAIDGRAFHLGVATAIDRRGYFLTAAHCLRKGPFKLIVPYHGEFGGVTARVVWRGNVSKGQPDLALLDAGLPLEHVFEWSPDFTNGEDVVALGLNVIAPHHTQTQCLAGKITGLTDSPATAAPQYQSIAVDMPLLREDNGGPLIATDGQLIGIDINSAKSGPTGMSGTAQRPDLAWLKQLIDQDAAKQSGARTR